VHSNTSVLDVHQIGLVGGVARISHMPTIGKLQCSLSEFQDFHFRSFLMMKWL